MTGVAQAADSIDDLVSFLGGEPEEAHEDEEDAEEDSPEQDEEEGSDEEEAPEEDEGEPEARKIKVTVKADDGSDSVEEIDETELIAGYQRQKAFTQKTMELAAKERQATEIVQQRVTEASQYALQHASIAKSMIAQFAGLKTDDELQRMAIESPGEWVQEQERTRQVTALWAQAESAIQAEQARIDGIKAEQEKEQARAAWEVLTAKGIDKDKLATIYGNVMKAYAVTPAQLNKLMEPGLALALKDALAYRDLQAKKPQTAQKVKEAERLPTTKKALPTSERVNRTLNEKFSKGRGKPTDLAAFLLHNKL